MRVTVDIPDRLWETYAGKANLSVDDAVTAAIAFSCNFGKVSGYISALELQVQELKLILTRNQLRQTEAGWKHQEQLQAALDIQAALNDELANWKQIAIAAQAKIEMLERRSPQLPPIDF